MRRRRRLRVRAPLSSGDGGNAPLNWLYLLAVEQLTTSARFREWRRVEGKGMERSSPPELNVVHVNGYECSAAYERKNNLSIGVGSCG